MIIYFKITPLQAPLSSYSSHYPADGNIPIFQCAKILISRLAISPNHRSAFRFEFFFLNFPLTHFIKALFMYLNTS